MRALASMIVATVFLVAAGALAQKAERAKAGVKCVAANGDFTYDCTFRLTRANGGAPIENAKVSVGADMPSMPGMHHMRPVEAKPAGEPGVYAARVALEMAGEWALVIRVTGPLRDQVIHRMRFE